MPLFYEYKCITKPPKFQPKFLHLFAKFQFHSNALWKISNLFRVKLGNLLVICWLYVFILLVNLLQNGKNIFSKGVSRPIFAVCLRIPLPADGLPLLSPLTARNYFCKAVLRILLTFCRSSPRIIMYFRPFSPNPCHIPILRSSGHLVTNLIN